MFSEEFDKHEQRKIGLYKKDSETGNWMYLTGAATNNTLDANVTELGELAIFYNESMVAIPTEFKLRQNYPNPFNPTTTIAFDLPEKQHVSLIIYNVLGQQIKALVNTVVDAGYKELKWNGTNRLNTKVSSGVYFYQLITPSNRITKKMILVK